MPSIIDSVLLAQKLAQMIRFPTICYDDPEKVDWHVFEAFQDKLKELFPLVHQKAKIERIDGHALFYHFQGSNPQKEGIMFMAHQDVVPPGDLLLWQHPPFSGIIEDGLVWGRGALDMKNQMAAFLEAMECLLKEGFWPKNDLYFFLGKDEEKSGDTSAKIMVREMQKRQICLRYVLDENLGFWDGQEWGIPKELAVMGLGEKGYAVLSLTARSDGGHASMPPSSSALGRVARAAIKVEENPMPIKVAYPIDAMIDVLLPYLPQKEKKHWRDGNKEAVAQYFAKTLRGNAVFRSTFALTQAKASLANNVLPETAKMCFNVRIAPWDQAEDLLDHVKKVIDDESIDAAYEQLILPSKIADVHSEGYHTLYQTIAKHFPKALPTPSLMLAGTDSHYFCEICPCVVRFSPFDRYRLYGHTVHAANERMDIESLKKGAEFFMHLIKQE